MDRTYGFTHVISSAMRIDNLPETYSGTKFDPPFLLSVLLRGLVESLL